jgi:hypothetical protein
MKIKNKDTEEIFSIEDYMRFFTKLCYDSFETIFTEEECTYILDGCGNWEYINTAIWKIIEE